MRIKIFSNFQTISITVLIGITLFLCIHNAFAANPVSVGIGGGGWVTSIKIQPDPVTTDQSSILSKKFAYTGTDTSGIFKCEFYKNQHGIWDYGSKWSPINDGLNTYNILSIAIAEGDNITDSDRKTVFIGTDGGIYVSYFTGSTLDTWSGWKWIGMNSAPWNGGKKNGCSAPISSICIIKIHDSVNNVDKRVVYAGGGYPRADNDKTMGDTNAVVYRLVLSDSNNNDWNNLAWTKLTGIATGTEKNHAAVHSLGAYLYNSTIKLMIGTNKGFFTVTDTLDSVNGTGFASNISPVDMTSTLPGYDREKHPDVDYRGCAVVRSGSTFYRFAAVRYINAEGKYMGRVLYSADTPKPEWKLVGSSDNWGNQYNSLDGLAAVCDSQNNCFILTAVGPGSTARGTAQCRQNISNLDNAKWMYSTEVWGYEVTAGPWDFFGVSTNAVEIDKDNQNNCMAGDSVNLFYSNNSGTIWRTLCNEIAKCENYNQISRMSENSPNWNQSVPYGPDAYISSGMETSHVLDAIVVPSKTDPSVNRPWQLLMGLGDVGIVRSADSDYSRLGMYFDRYRMKQERSAAVNDDPLTSGGRNLYKFCYLNELDYPESSKFPNKSEVIYAATGTRDFYPAIPSNFSVSEDGGKTWTKLAGGHVFYGTRAIIADPGYTDIPGSGDKRLYFSGQNEQVSPNERTGGVNFITSKYNWKPIPFNTGFKYEGGAADDYPNVIALFIKAGNPDWLYAVAGEYTDSAKNKHLAGLYKRRIYDGSDYTYDSEGSPIDISHHPEREWQMIPLGNSYNLRSVCNIKYDGSKNRLYLGNTNRGFNTVAGLYYIDLNSDDKGYKLTPTAVLTTYNTVPQQYLTITGIEVDPKNNNYIYFSTGGYSSWADDRLDDVNLYYNGRYNPQTNSGVYKLDMGNQNSLTPIGIGLGTKVVRLLKFINVNGKWKLFIGTAGCGLYIYDPDTNMAEPEETLLVDSDFEKGVVCSNHGEGWCLSDGNGVIKSDLGSSVLESTSPGINPSYTTIGRQYFKVTSGARYNISFDVAESSTNGRFRVEFNEFNAQGVQIGHNAVNDITDGFPTAAGIWKRVEKNITVGNGTSYVEMVLKGCRTNNINCTLYFDNFIRPAVPRNLKASLKNNGKYKFAVNWELPANVPTDYYSEYKICVGYIPGNSSVIGWTTVSGTSTSTELAAPDNVRQGNKYYISIMGRHSDKWSRLVYTSL